MRNQFGAGQRLKSSQQANCVRSTANDRTKCRDAAVPGPNAAIVPCKCGFKLETEEICRFILPDDARYRAVSNVQRMPRHQRTLPTATCQRRPNLQYAYMSLAGTRPRSDGRDHYPRLIAARDVGVVWTDEKVAGHLVPIAGRAAALALSMTVRASRRGRRSSVNDAFLAH
jgi:hypothetical protein